jgi:uncharacterized membrane protein
LFGLVRLRKENKPVKPIILVGIVLIILGVAALTYQGITYTTREKVLEIGPLEATKKTEKTIPLPPLLGGVALAVGIVLIILGARKE